MMPYFSVLAGFIIPVVLWKRESISLRDPVILPFWERVAALKGTLITGIVLIFIFLLTSGGTMDETPKATYHLFGLNKSSNFGMYQLVTYFFLHKDITHLVSNLAVLMLLSDYEYKKGTGRFAMVYIFSGIFAGFIDIFVGVPGLVVIGASSSICGLAAAYYTDYDNLTYQEWVMGSIMVLAMIFVLSLFGAREDVFAVDHIGHLGGAIGGFLICRMFREKKKRTILRRKNK